MNKGVNSYLTYDIFDNSQSALRLNNDFLKVPSGIYFKYSFTMIFWIKLHYSPYDTRIINFGNLIDSDNYDNIRIGIPFFQKVYFFIKSNKYVKDILVAKQVY